MLGHMLIEIQTRLTGKLTQLLLLLKIVELQAVEIGRRVAQQDLVLSRIVCSVHEVALLEVGIVGQIVLGLTRVLLIQMAVRSCWRLLLAQRLVRVVLCWCK